LGPAEQHADQNLLTGDPWGDGLVVAVRHLGDDQVLEQVQALWTWHSAAMPAVSVAA